MYGEPTYVYSYVKHGTREHQGEKGGGLSPPDFRYKLLKGAVCVRSKSPSMVPTRDLGVAGRNGEEKRVALLTKVH